MLSRSSHRITAALVAGCCLAGGIATAVSGASAHTAANDVTVQTTSSDNTAQVRKALARRKQGDGLASMSSPYIPGVPHVPASVGLAISPGGVTHYIGPEGSIFNGPAAKVEARVDAWWEEQMAAGVTPEEADEKLVEMAN
jgi:hypothetical protein